MGQLVDGAWITDNATPESVKGPTTADFRGWISKDGSAPDGFKGFKAEKGRYHVYVSYGCPFAHRTQIIRALKGLESLLPMSVVSPVLPDEGWSFEKNAPRVTGDLAHPEFKYLYQSYTLADPEISGRVTVPTIFDTKENTLVSVESGDQLRFLNEAFDDLGAKAGDFYPEHLRSKIDEVNQWVDSDIIAAGYKAAFATSQDVYKQVVDTLFAALDRTEELLSKQRYLVGDTFTEADIRLFVNLVRFDVSQATAFKLTRKRIADYPNISGYLREIYQLPGVADTTDFEHILLLMFGSARSKATNPNLIIPEAPEYDWNAPHGREKIGSK